MCFFVFLFLCFVSFWCIFVFSMLCIMYICVSYMTPEVVGLGFRVALASALQTIVNQLNPAEHVLSRQERLLVVLGSCGLVLVLGRANSHHTAGQPHLVDCCQWDCRSLFLCLELKLKCSPHSEPFIAPEDLNVRNVEKTATSVFFGEASDILLLHLNQCIAHKLHLIEFCFVFDRYSPYK